MLTRCSTVQVRGAREGGQRNNFGKRRSGFQLSLRCLRHSGYIGLVLRREIWAGTKHVGVDTIFELKL